MLFRMQLVILITCLSFSVILGQKERARDFGIKIGVLETGTLNAITDIACVKVGHTTIISGDSIRTGVTAILPHGENIFQSKVPAAVFVENGFGKLAGSTQIEELGNIETPIILTNTLSVGTAITALVKYTLSLEGNEHVRSVNAVVGETNDGWLNDIRGLHVEEKDIFNAIQNSSPGEVAEGSVGAGTGTTCFGFKGGIGTSSRKVPESLGGWTVGVLVQTNFGGVLTIAGTPVGEKLGKYYLKDKLQNSPDGSCMIVVATDAPLDSRNLKRLAKRAMLGLARTGGIASNGSGDYVIAFSTAEELRIPYRSTSRTISKNVLRNEQMSPLFLAVIEATEEAIINSLFAAEKVQGMGGHTAEALPIKTVLQILRDHSMLK